MIKVTEDWANSNILLTIHGSDYVLYSNPTHKDQWLFGKSSHGSIEISVEEAKTLIVSLQTAIKAYEDLDNSIWIVNSNQVEG